MANPGASPGYPLFRGGEAWTQGEAIWTIWAELMLDYLEPLAGGAVASVTAADTSVVVGGTVTNVTVRTGTLDVIATIHAPAADWSNNGHKITGLANGTLSTDAAAFGQLPTALSQLTGNIVNTFNGATGAVTLATDQVDNPQALGAAAPGSSGKFSDVAHIHPTTGLVTAVNGSSGSVTVVGAVAAADTSIVVGGTATAPTLRTGIQPVLNVYRTTTGLAWPTINTIMPYDAVEDDNASGFSLVTHKYTVPSAGRYLVAAALGVTTSQTNAGYVVFLVHNSTIFAQDGMVAYTPLPPADIVPSVTKVIQCAAGDTLYAEYVASTSGSTVTAGSATAYLCIIKVSN